MDSAVAGDPARVLLTYEAGCEGFWLARRLCETAFMTTLFETSLDTSLREFTVEFCRSAFNSASFQFRKYLYNAHFFLPI